MGCNCGKPSAPVHIPVKNIPVEPPKPAEFGIGAAAKALFSKDGLASDEVKKKRIDVCGKCEHLAITRQCKVCLCFVDLKTKFSDASCPKFKW